MVGNGENGVKMSHNEVDKTPARYGVSIPMALPLVDRVMPWTSPSLVVIVTLIAAAAAVRPVLSINLVCSRIKSALSIVI